MKPRKCCKCKQELSEKLIKEHRFLCDKCYEENKKSELNAYEFGLFPKVRDILKNSNIMNFHYIFDLEGFVL